MLATLLYHPQNYLCPIVMSALSSTDEPQITLQLPLAASTTHLRYLIGSRYLNIGVTFFDDQANRHST